METLNSYRIVYNVHCRFENFFEKEIIVKNCYSEVHAKYKLAAYCEKKYGVEFEFITFKTVTKEIDVYNSDIFNDIFDKTDKNNENLGFNDNIFSNLFGKTKKRK